jgi:hypothetical protein
VEIANSHGSESLGSVVSGVGDGGGRNSAAGSGTVSSSSPRVQQVLEGWAMAQALVKWASNHLT